MWPFKHQHVPYYYTWLILMDKTYKPSRLQYRGQERCVYCKAELGGVKVLWEAADERPA